MALLKSEQLTLPPTRKLSCEAGIVQIFDSAGWRNVAIDCSTWYSKTSRGAAKYEEGENS
jgi:hypothetical protein